MQTIMDKNILIELINAQTNNTVDEFVLKYQDNPLFGDYFALYNHIYQYGSYRANKAVKSKMAELKKEINDLMFQYE